MIRVLVVDDDFMVARVHSGFVGRTPGFEVVGVAHTGADAVRVAEGLRPDLVLLDIHLPDIDGIEVLRRLRERCPDLDVLVVTAARETETVRRALHGGVVHYLMKPFEYDDLRERLEHYATVHRPLTGAERAEQAEVDRVFGGRSATGRAPLPKGVSPETAAAVERVLRESSDSVSAAECAKLVGVSRVSARRYLEHFVARGRAEVSLRYGSTGRPERRYRWRRPD